MEHSGKLNVNSDSRFYLLSGKEVPPGLADAVLKSAAKRSDRHIGNAKKKSCNANRAELSALEQSTAGLFEARLCSEL